MVIVLRFFRNSNSLWNLKNPRQESGQAIEGHLGYINKYRQRIVSSIAGPPQTVWKAPIAVIRRLEVHFQAGVFNGGIENSCGPHPRVGYHFQNPAEIEKMI